MLSPGFLYEDAGFRYRPTSWCHSNLSRPTLVAMVTKIFAFLHKILASVVHGEATTSWALSRILVCVCVWYLLMFWPKDTVLWTSDGSYCWVVVAVDTAACRNSRADIAFVLDASGSIVYDKPNSTLNFTNWNLMKAFVITLIRSLRVSQTETRVALVRFSHESGVVFQLNSYSTAEQAVQVIFTLVHHRKLLFSGIRTKSIVPNSTTRTPATDMLYNTTNGQKFATSRHLDMSRCWTLALRCGKFVVQQVVDLLWACPLAVLYNMFVAGVRVVEFGTK